MYLFNLIYTFDSCVYSCQVLCICDIVGEFLPFGGAGSFIVLSIGEAFPCGDWVCVRVHFCGDMYPYAFI